MIRVRNTRWILSILTPTLGACLVGYFTFHAVQGDHGLLRMKRLERDLATAEALRDDLRDERLHWQHQADLLNPQALGFDMLEERGRHMLNVGKPNEYIIYLD